MYTGAMAKYSPIQNPHQSYDRRLIRTVSQYKNSPLSKASLCGDSTRHVFLAEFFQNTTECPTHEDSELIDNFL